MKNVYRAPKRVGNVFYDAENDVVTIQNDDDYLRVLGLCTKPVSDDDETVEFVRSEGTECYCVDMEDKS